MPRIRFAFLQGNGFIVERGDWRIFDQRPVKFFQIDLDVVRFRASHTLPREFDAPFWHSRFVFGFDELRRSRAGRRCGCLCGGNGGRWRDPSVHSRIYSNSTLPLRN